MGGREEGGKEREGREREEGERERREREKEGGRGRGRGRERERETEILTTILGEATHNVALKAKSTSLLLCFAYGCNYHHTLPKKYMHETHDM